LTTEQREILKKFEAVEQETPLKKQYKKNQKPKEARGWIMTRLVKFSVTCAVLFLSLVRHSKKFENKFLSTLRVSRRENSGMRKALLSPKRMSSL